MDHISIEQIQKRDDLKRAKRYAREFLAHMKRLDVSRKEAFQLIDDCDMGER